VLKQIYKKKVLGVNRLRTKYGSKKNRGFKPERFVKAGGKIIRTILQQADKAGFTESVKDLRGVKEKRMGRKLTEKGRKFMEELQ
jgi:small subunit ribosomal protein S19e